MILMKKRAKYSFIPLVLLMTGLCACGQHADSQEVDSPEVGDRDDSYVNPVMNIDFADPTPVKAPDGFYYVYATNSEENGSVVNIQVARSEDLVNWTRVGDVLPERPSWATRDFWAPHVFYDEDSQIYYLYYSGESNDEAQGKCLGVATSKKPEGPFVDMGEPLLCGDGFVNIDPMSLDDPASGKKFLYWGSGFEAIKVQELADDRISFKEGSEAVELVHPIANEDPENYQRLVEGAWVVYRNGFYYMFYSGDNCCGEDAHYAVMVARAEQPTGPFRTMAEVTGSGNSVILERNERWNAPGHNSIITDEAGNDWMLYHAIDTESDASGRVMLLDKVSYESGWPQLEKGTPSIGKTPAPVTE